MDCIGAVWFPSEHNEKVKMWFGSFNPIADTNREQHRYAGKQAQVAMIHGCVACVSGSRYVCASAINGDKAASEYKCWASDVAKYCNT